MNELTIKLQKSLLDAERKKKGLTLSHREVKSIIALQKECGRLRLENNTLNNRGRKLEQFRAALVTLKFCIDDLEGKKD